MINKIKKILILLFFMLVISANIFPDPEKFYLFDDFEEELRWRLDDWKNNSIINAKLSEDFISHGKKSMELKIDAKYKNHRGVVQIFDIGNLKNVSEVRFDIYNSSLKKIKIRLMLKTGRNWLYHESKAVIIRPGWNKNITFNLRASIYGGENSGVYNKKIKGIKNVRRFGILIEPLSRTYGFLYIDNFRISGENIKNLLPPEKPENLKKIFITGFESGRINWYPATDWSCAKSIEKVRIKTTQGNYALKCDFDLKTPGENAVFYYEGKLNLKDVYEIKADIYSPFDFSMNLSFALSTGDNWAWQESKVKTLHKGWNKDVTFYFKKRTWKNEKTKWKNITLPDNINDVKRLCFVFFPPDMGKGFVLIDNIRMTTTDETKLESLKPVSIGKLSYFTWYSFEKGVINWQPYREGSSAISVYPAYNFGGEKRRGMQMNFDVLTPTDKAMFIYKGNIDFSDAIGMSFDIYNPMDTGVKISLAFKVGEDETWYETKLIPISPGWNKDIFFDFISPSFKSADTNWNYTDYFFDRNDIREIYISIIPDKKLKGSLYITDFKLARKNYLGDFGDLIGPVFINNSDIIVENIKYTLWKSFEDGINNWEVSTDSNFGAGSIEISDLFATKGKKSLKFKYKDIGVKSGIYYQPSSQLDFSKYSYITLDIYNSGRPVKLSIAFIDNNNLWTESKEIVLNSGWNKNIQFSFDEPIWKNEKTGYRNITKLTNRDKITKFYIIVQNGYEGTIYIDNIRLGEKIDIMNATETKITQKIKLISQPVDFLTTKISFLADYYNEKNTDLYINSFDLNLRGFGNEINIFAGENTNLFNDSFSMLDSTSLGNHNYGIKLNGTIAPLDISYQLCGVSLWTDMPFNFGSSYILGGGIKKYFLENNFLGFLYYNDRRGFVYEGDLSNSTVEQSTHILGGDFYINLNISDMFFGLNGEYLTTFYDTLTPVFLLENDEITYVTYSISDNDNKDLIYLSGDFHIGELTLYSNYTKIGEKFGGIYINQDKKIGSEAIFSKITYILDNLPPFYNLKQISSEWANFVRYTTLTLEYDTNLSLIDTYERNTYRIVLQNDQSLALYNYQLSFKYNYEGNAEDTTTNQIDTRIPSYTYSFMTKILFNDYVSLKLLARAESTLEPVYNETKNIYEDEEALNLTGFLELGIQIQKNTNIKLSYKILSSQDIHQNFYGEIETILWGSVSLALSYGDEPFSGYWLDDLTDDTVNKYMIKITGYF